MHRMQHTEPLDIRFDLISSNQLVMLNARQINLMCLVLTSVQLQTTRPPLGLRLPNKIEDTHLTSWIWKMIYIFFNRRIIL